MAKSDVRCDLSQQPSPSTQYILGKNPACNSLQWKVKHTHRACSEFNKNGSKNAPRHDLKLICRVCVVGGYQQSVKAVVIYCLALLSFCIS